MTTLAMTRGDDRALDITVVDANSDHIDLTDLHLRFMAKKALTDLDEFAVISKLSDGGSITVGPDPFNVATVAITAADTSTDFFYGQGRVLLWDLQGRDGYGKVLTLARGVLVISADVTRTAS